MAYVCNRKCHISQNLVCWQERPHHDESTASRLLREVNHHWAQLVLWSGTTLESSVLFFWLPETSMDMAIKCSSTAPCRFGFRDKQRSSILTSGGRGKYDTRLYVVNKTAVYWKKKFTGKSNFHFIYTTLNKLWWCIERNGWNFPKCTMRVDCSN